jgi:protein-tyrosine phosphatase
MTQVLKNLYISDSKTVKDIFFLNDRNIKTIINCTSEIPNFFPSEFRYVKLNMNDNLSENIETRLSLSFFFIKKALENNEGIVVHCHMGISRSATIILYFLMKMYSWTYCEAYNFLKTKRPEIQPNFNYETQLRKQNTGQMYFKS